ncbi:MAG: hypothetical protein KAQ98_13415 [Bacteriovoracaceae bacterium]|nr:hypothetical protein [Bacteriovoracaceae bacterium]
MNKDRHTPENHFQKIKSITRTENDSQVFSTDSPVNLMVNIRPNKSISPGKFKKDPFTPGGYLAHPNTIRAVRKEIFMAGEEFIDLEKIYVCESCHNKVDLQFWHFCPYCEASFPKNIEN